jgi:hypothetical protein
VLLRLPSPGRWALFSLGFQPVGKFWKCLPLRAARPFPAPTGRGSQRPRAAEWTPPAEAGRASPAKSSAPQRFAPALSPPVRLVLPGLAAVQSCASCFVSRASFRRRPTISGSGPLPGGCGVPPAVSGPSKAFGWPFLDAVFFDSWFLAEGFFVWNLFIGAKLSCLPCSRNCHRHGGPAALGRASAPVNLTPQRGGEEGAGHQGGAEPGQRPGRQQRQVVADKGAAVGGTRRVPVA